MEFSETKNADEDNVDKDIQRMIDELKVSRPKKRRPKPINNDMKIDTKDDYNVLLKRIYGSSIIDAVKVSIAPPKVIRMGTRKVVWTNFIENCETIKRDPEQIMNYFMNELMVSGNFDINKKFIIKGVFNPTQILSIFTKYIRTYVKCQSCGCINTRVNKEDKMHVLTCNICLATRNIENIKRKN
jgi:translation initiation factor 2 subunit 2